MSKIVDRYLFSSSPNDKVQYNTHIDTPNADKRRQEAFDTQLKRIQSELPIAEEQERIEAIAVKEQERINRKESRRLLARRRYKAKKLMSSDKIKTLNEFNIQYPVGCKVLVDQKNKGMNVLVIAGKFYTRLDAPTVRAKKEDGSKTTLALSRIVKKVED